MSAAAKLSRAPARLGAAPRPNRRRGVSPAPAPAPRRVEARSGDGARARPRRFLRATARLAVAGGLAYAALLGARGVYEHATTSPRFEVAHLVFEPTPHVDDARLRELLALPAHANILALDLQELGERVAADAWIAQATVTRRLPDTLEIAVAEHEPAVAVLAGKLYLVDAAGTLFKEAEPGERGELPVITGIDRRLLLEDRAAAEVRIREGLAVLSAYAEKQRPRLSEIHLGESGEVSLYTSESGTQLRLGRGETASKLARFDALRAAIGERADKLAVVHLDAGSTPDRPDRVVARFFSRDAEATLLAEAQLARRQGAAQEQVERAGAAGSTVADRAPRKRRIPRAH